MDFTVTDREKKEKGAHRNKRRMMTDRPELTNKTWHNTASDQGPHWLRFSPAVLDPTICSKMDMHA